VVLEDTGLWGKGGESFWESKLENFLMGILIFNSDYFWNENPAARGEDIAF